MMFVYVSLLSLLFSTSGCSLYWLLAIYSLRITWDRMAVRFILFCMQNIEFAPATSVWKRAVVGNEKPAAQAQRAIVGTDTQSCTAKSQDCWTKKTPLLENLAQSLIHLLQGSGRRCWQIGPFPGDGQSRLCLKEKCEQPRCWQTAVVRRGLWYRKRLR